MNPIEQTDDNPSRSCGELLDEAYEDITNLRSALADYYVMTNGGPAVSEKTEFLARQVAVKLGFIHG